MPAYTFDRRRLLAGAGSLALLAGAGASMTGCDQTGKTTNTAAKNETVALPTYERYSGVTPDLPGTEQGVDPAFRNFPKDRPQSVPEKPGSGSDKVSAMANIYYAVPPGPSGNPWWADLNKKMGIDLDIQMVPSADYPTKFATTIAGNDLPDVMMMRQPPTLIANLPQLLKAKFTDLSKYLSGDAVKEYPNLANIPTVTWKSAIFNGGIYGIPIPRGRIGHYNFIRQDLFEAKGLPIAPKGYDETFKVCKELTNPKKRTWAFSMIGQAQNLLININKVPNQWREEGGKLTRSYETDEFKQTVNDLITWWKAGVLHPAAFDTNQPFKQLFNSGTCAINAHDGYPGWTQYILDNQNNPKFKLGLMPVYDREGSELAPWDYGTGIFSIVGIKKQDSEDRTKMLLRMLNYLAAPFGTEEYFFRLYGKQGRDHTLDKNDNPVFTKEGTANLVVPVRYLADAPYTIYQPGRPQDADTQHDYQSLEIPVGIADPTIGLFSNTLATKNATIDKKFNDGVHDIIQGRQPLDHLDDLVKAWQKGGGDDIRKEYQDQLQQAGGNPSDQPS